MLRKNFSIFLIVFVLLSFSNNPIFSYAEDQVYNENEVLDSIASDWIKTCETMMEYCNKGILEASFGSVGDILIDTAEFDGIQDYVVTISKDEFIELLDSENDKQSAAISFNTLLTSSIGADLIQAENSLKSLLNTKTKCGLSFTKLFLESAKLQMGTSFASKAKNYFAQAKNTDSISEKRRNMAQGAKNAIKACAIAIKDVDDMIKNPELTEDELLQVLLDNGLSALSNTLPGVDVFAEGVKLFISTTLSLNSVDSVLKSLNGYIDGSKTVVSDPYAFFTCISNQYAEYEYVIDSKGIKLNDYNGYLLDNSEYEIVDIPSNKYGFEVNRTDSVFLYDLSIKEVTIPETLDNISFDFIMKCNSLENIYINSNIKDSSMFCLIEGCSSDFDIIFGEHVTSIPAHFISNCGITEIEIPSRITKIGTGFLSKCPIEEIDFPEGLTSVGNRILVNCNKLKTVKLPTTLKDVSYELICDCNALENVYINSNLQSSGFDYIIKECTSDFDIVFGNGVTKIPNTFISDCGITEMDFPEGLTSVGNRILVNCNKLKTVKLPTTLKDVSYELIYDCNALENVYINSNLQSSGFDYIIKECTSDFDIVFGNGVTKIPNKFISNCGLSELIFPLTVATVNSNSFMNNNSLEIVKFYNSSISLSTDYFETCSDEITIAGYAGSTAEDFAERYGYSFIPFDSHILKRVPATEPTCTASGNALYYECETCNNYYSDALAKLEIEKDSWIIAPTGHDLVWHDEVKPTCRDKGRIGCYICSRCNKFFSDTEGKVQLDLETVVIDTLQHNLVEISASSPTCTECGNIQYWRCMSCDACFLNDLGLNPCEEHDYLINPRGHDLKEHPYKAATTETSGNNAYWECFVCSKCFSDSNGTIEIAEDSWIIPKKESGGGTSGGAGGGTPSTQDQEQASEELLDAERFNAIEDIRHELDGSKKITADIKRLSEDAYNSISMADTLEKIQSIKEMYVESIKKAFIVNSTKVIQNKLKAYKNGKIKLSFKRTMFSDGSVAMKYQIYRKENNKSYKLIKTHSNKSTSKTIAYTDSKKLRRKKTYYYRVRAIIQLPDGSYAHSDWSKAKGIKCKKSRK